MTPGQLQIKPSQSARSSDLWVRSWVLLLLDATSRNGLSPISKLRFHRLVYVTNCLATLYSLDAADERIVKFRRGPFYPVLQWHLDRLVGQGILKISKIRYFTDLHGPWMDADYSLDRRAVGVVEALCAFDDLRALTQFLMEVVKAYAAQGDEGLDDLLLSDVTYDDQRRAMGAVIDFSKMRENLSAQAANSFAALVRDPRLVSLEDRVHLYVNYMDRVWRRSRVAG